MKRFPTSFVVMVAAIALLACEKLDNLEPMKNMKAEFNQPADSGDQAVPEEGTLPGEETMPEEGTTPEIDPVPEVKDPVEEFNRMYPDAFDVEWEDEGNYWEVSFEMGEAGSVVECEAIYDKNGNWLCTETEISVNDVPQYVWDALAASEYAGAESRCTKSRQ